MLHIDKKAILFQSLIIFSPKNQKEVKYPTACRKTCQTATTTADIILPF